jgi:hypothetical protein
MNALKMESAPMAGRDAAESPFSLAEDPSGLAPKPVPVTPGFARDGGRDGM